MAVQRIEIHLDHIKFPVPGFRGYLVLFASMLSIYFGYFFQDIILTAIGTFLLFFLVLSFYFCRRNLKDMRLTRYSAAEVFAAYPLKIRYHIESGDNKQHFQFAIYDSFCGHSFEKPGELRRKGKNLDVSELNEPQDLKAFTQFKERGVWDSFPIRIESRFPFGLFCSSYQQIVDFEITVFPEPLEDPNLIPLNFAKVGSDDIAVNELNEEFYKVREYRNGDPLRLINWALSAKHSQLVVSEYQSLSNSQYLLVYHASKIKSAVVKEDSSLILRALSTLILNFKNEHRTLIFIADFNNWERIEIVNDHSMNEALKSLARADVKSTHAISKLKHVLESHQDMHIILCSHLEIENWNTPDLSPYQIICLDGNLDCTEMSYEA